VGDLGVLPERIGQNHRISDLVFAQRPGTTIKEESVGGSHFDMITLSLSIKRCFRPTRTAKFKPKNKRYWPEIRGGLSQRIGWIGWGFSNNGLALAQTDPWLREESYIVDKAHFHRVNGRIQISRGQSHHQLYRAGMALNSSLISMVSREFSTFGRALLLSNSSIILPAKPLFLSGETAVFGLYRVWDRHLLPEPKA